MLINLLNFDPQREKIGPEFPSKINLYLSYAHIARVLRAMPMLMHTHTQHGRGLSVTSFTD